ncbi:CheW protein [Thermincola ferriacetica]|uniref:CheW protein n=1 Tax=Thermincola ferriacetica TaxID=281456 RepID=A0A0L6W150_9FIRM|nr:chemotaxis protein CheW [Thermincola ferriacetica]KNZ69196.1 CheW protein [Thermincola ferriacetica]
MSEENNYFEKQYVVFRLGKETYGLDIESVREIITMQNITEVPRTLEYIEGVINLRGRVIPVYNIRRKFGLPEEEITRASRIVVVEVEGNTIGMIVDGVSEVLRISSEMVERPSEIVCDVDTEYLAGVAKLNDKLVILLDIDKVLSKDEHPVLENIS